MTDLRVSRDLEKLLAEAPFVPSLARRLLFDEEDDIVQQTYLQALEHRDATLSSPRRWLARIARNAVRNLLRGGEC